MLTPDFDSYEKRIIKGLEVTPLGLSVHYGDVRISHHLAADLREHCPNENSTHPVTREALLSPLDIPDGFILPVPSWISVRWYRCIGHKN